MKLKTVVVDGKTYAEVNDQGLPLYRCSIQFNYLAKDLIVLKSFKRSTITC